MHAPIKILFGCIYLQVDRSIRKYNSKDQAATANHSGHKYSVQRKHSSDIPNTRQLWFNKTYFVQMVVVLPIPAVPKYLPLLGPNGLLLPSFRLVHYNILT